MFNPKIIKTDYALAANQGDSRVAQRKYIIAHESGYEPDTKKPDMLKNEVQNMRNNFNGVNTPYVTHFVGYMDSADEVQVYQIGEPGYVSWGALDANPYAPVQIEFARIYQNNKEKFTKTYRVYVEALRYYANLYGIPVKLDEPGNGIKSHLWVTNNFGGTHSDPYGYFQRMGISKAQFKHDVENGFKDEVETKDTIVNVVQAASDKVEGYTTYKLDGTANETTNISPGSRWISNGIEVINSKAHFAIGRDIYLPQSATTLRGKLIINYKSGYGVKSFNHTGASIPNSNQRFKAGSAWKTMNDLIKIPGVGYCYKVATDEYVPAKYQQGSGFKG